MGPESMFTAAGSREEAGRQAWLASSRLVLPSDAQEPAEGELMVF